jgi:NAD(P)-dependent dehydrogenase (short-subunit alcohol dehydrogenase family)
MATASAKGSSLGVPGFALVTGAGSGIGRATSLLLAREGCSGIALADINKQSVEAVKIELMEVTENPNFCCITLAVDVRDEASVGDMVTRAVEAFGRLDYAVNCAGIGLKKPFIETEMADWNKMIAINLTGVFCCVKAETQQMLKQVPREAGYGNPSIRKRLRLNLTDFPAARTSPYNEAL